ncbi:hypothetical protein [Brachybacterium sacelli]|uniref:Uncharacterized protein n=1 Tax=Brachybacterium sacelli TaxID=173364 RepID=A0ABS4WVN4_9MICO|nr:hypothetical protein [Brachybacterium sacelli]MBP2380206.1 hypothetical protein [Brachybacterium sacelli]
MNDPTRKRPTRIPWITAIAGVTAALLVVLAVVLFPEQDAPDPPPTPSPTEAATSASGSATLSLPDDTEPVSFRFDVDAEQSVLLEASVTATYTASTGERRALYAIIGMSCGSIDGPTNTQSVNGTENLIHQTTRQMTQLLSYDVETPGAHRCTANVSAPNWDPEYGDAELSLTASIRLVTEDESAFHHAPTKSQQPIVLDPEEEALVVDETFPLAAGRRGDLAVMSGTHLTSCTITNGSRDRTAGNLCTEPLVDRGGSTVATRTVVDQLQGDEVCRTVTADRTLTSIDHLVHHRLLHSEETIEGFLANPCGDRLRIRHHVANDGPAALVVHRDSTKAVSVAH